MTGFTVTDEMVQAGAEARLRQYTSGRNADHLTWRDFTNEAREVLEDAARTAQPACPCVETFGRLGGSVDPACTIHNRFPSQLTATRGKLTEALAAELLRNSVDEFNDVPRLVGYLVEELLASGVVQEASAQPTPVVDEKRLATALAEHDVVWRGPLGDRTQQCACGWMPDHWETEDEFLDEYWDHRSSSIAASGVLQSEANVRADQLDRVVRWLATDIRWFGARQMIAAHAAAIRAGERDA